jgi:hypothetical protein
VDYFSLIVREFVYYHLMSPFIYNYTTLSDIVQPVQSLDGKNY